MPDRRAAPVPFAKTAGGVAYRTFGAGEPLVLMHGGAGSWEHWVLSVDALATAFRVLALDLPGYGDSDRPEWDISTDDYLAYVVGAVEEIAAGAPRIHLAGFSFGGLVAAATALALGPRAGSLSMTGGAGYGPPSGRSFTLESRRKLAQRLGRAPTAQELRDMHAENLAKLMIHDRAKIDGWAIDMQFRNVERTRFDSRRLSWSGDTPSLIGRLACPVAVIYGAHDAAAIPPIDQRFALCRAARPDVETHVIPNCGHWAMYEAPEALNPLLLDFHRRAMLPASPERRAEP
ncbi:MAG TPA: alpha/beta fold hydrolase [Thermohalobaculum sp.]|nr:alpha/beta fold hydrolase [Thermohalobaculum sp.]